MEWLHKDHVISIGPWVWIGNDADHIDFNASADPYEYSLEDFMKDAKRF
jgi:hypothetical protein